MASQPLRTILFLVFFSLAIPALASQNRILVVGDSISAAYGIESDAAWARLLQKRLQEQGLTGWQVINASISGETTDGGLRRLPKLLEQHSPQVVVIELGGNDGLRGFPPNVIESNLEAMITLAREADARVLLVGMQIPPNYGERYTTMFANIFPKLSDRYNTALVPFFLQGIYDQDELMQDDGIHPTAPAQPRLLDNLWPELEPLLR